MYFNPGSSTTQEDDVLDASTESTLETNDFEFNDEIHGNSHYHGYITRTIHTT